MRLFSSGTNDSIAEYGKSEVFIHSVRDAAVHETLYDDSTLFKTCPDIADNMEIQTLFNGIFDVYDTAQRSIQVPGFPISIFPSSTGHFRDKCVPVTPEGSPSSNRIPPINNDRKAPKAATLGMWRPSPLGPLAQKDVSKYYPSPMSSMHPSPMSPVTIFTTTCQHAHE